MARVSSSMCPARPASTLLAVLIVFQCVSAQTATSVSPVADPTTASPTTTTEEPAPSTIDPASTIQPPPDTPSRFNVSIPFLESFEDATNVLGIERTMTRSLVGTHAGSWAQTQSDIAIDSMNGFTGVMLSFAVGSEHLLPASDQSVFNFTMFATDGVGTSVPVATLALFANAPGYVPSTLHVTTWFPDGSTATKVHNLKDGFISSKPLSDVYYQLRVELVGSQASTDTKMFYSLGEHNPAVTEGCAPVERDYLVVGSTETHVLGLPFPERPLSNLVMLSADSTSDQNLELLLDCVTLTRTPPPDTPLLPFIDNFEGPTNSLGVELNLEGVGVLPAGSVSRLSVDPFREASPVGFIGFNVVPAFNVSEAGADGVFRPIEISLYMASTSGSPMPTVVLRAHSFRQGGGAGALLALSLSTGDHDGTGDVIAELPFPLPEGEMYGIGIYFSHLNSSHASVLAAAAGPIDFASLDPSQPGLLELLQGLAPLMLASAIPWDTQAIFLGADIRIDESSDALIDSLGVFSSTSGVPRYTSAKELPVLIDFDSEVNEFHFDTADDGTGNMVGRVPSPFVETLTFANSPERPRGLAFDFLFNVTDPQQTANLTRASLLLSKQTFEVFFDTSLVFNEANKTWDMRLSSPTVNLFAGASLVPGNWYKVVAMVTDDGLYSITVQHPGTGASWYVEKESGVLFPMVSDRLSGDDKVGFLTVDVAHVELLVDNILIFTQPRCPSTRGVRLASNKAAICWNGIDLRATFDLRQPSPCNETDFEGIFIANDAPICVDGTNLGLLTAFLVGEPVSPFEVGCDRANSNAALALDAVSGAICFADEFELYSSVSAAASHRLLFGAPGLGG